MFSLFFSDYFTFLRPFVLNLVGFVALHVILITRFGIHNVTRLCLHNLWSDIRNNVGQLPKDGEREYIYNSIKEKDRRRATVVTIGT